MEKVWKIKEEISFETKLSDKYHPAVLSLLALRGIQDASEVENFFHFNYDEGLTETDLILGMKEAVERIVLAKEKKEKIAIFGDYDADGVTAAAVLFGTLRDLDFEETVSYIPDRQLEGYGMNEKALEYLQQEGVSLIITVDCGITNFFEVEKAKKLGMDVIITDHHHVPEKIPEAVSVINPNLPASGFKSAFLAGVGVAFKLAQVLYQKMQPDKIEQLKWMLDLVAIGTVADCVPLLGENRVLTRYGLVVLSKTKRVGLQEMFKVGRIAISMDCVPDTQKVAFQIAPRINAAGRMDHAAVSYNLIIEEDRVKARALALEVEDKNQARQKITAEIVREVKAVAENSFKEKKLILASSPHWPVGILGLVAGKVMDEYKKPIIILQDQGEVLVGSLRSVPELNIVEALHECSDLLLKFGGHAQAAGITLSKDKAEKFYEKIAAIAEEKLKDYKIVSSISVDLEISADQIDWDLAGELRKMEPFGQGNPEPVFLAKKMFVADVKMVGNGSKHLKLGLKPSKDSPKIFDAIGFSMGEEFVNLQSGDIIDAVFNLSEDEWNGNKKIQLKLIDIKKITS